MRTLGFCVVGLVFSLTVGSSIANAQNEGVVPAPPPVMNAAPAMVNAPQGVANGFVIQPRVQTQSSLLGAVLADPGFLIGYRTGDLTVGIGASFTRTAASQDTDEVSLLILQVMPAIAYDVWKSGDGRARFSLLGAVGYGHASVDVQSTDTTTTPPTTMTDTAKIGFIPFRLGVGADYFFHPNFGIGGEAGVQSKILTSADVSGMSQDVSVSDSALFGAFHLTFIVGG